MERHFQSEHYSTELLQHRRSAPDQAHGLVGATGQSHHGQETLPAGLVPWHSRVVGGSYIEASLFHQQSGVHQVHVILYVCIYSYIHVCVVYMPI